MKSGKKFMMSGAVLLLLFAVWTLLIQIVDVKPVGVNETNIGFSAINVLFFEFTGVHFVLYNITDWLGLVPLVVCIMFGVFGFIQLIKRKSLLKVDADIMALGVYYVVVIGFYLIFEEIPINFRPVLINGYMESSYPSSTTLLVLSVMPTLVEQANRRIQSGLVKRILSVAVIGFSLFMVVGRLLSGVHWITDIIGSVLLSMGVFCFYKAMVMHLINK